MTTQELLADGKIVYDYVSAGQLHKMNVRVKLKRSTVSVGSQPDIEKWNNSSVSTDIDGFTLMFLTQMIKGYLSTDHFDGYNVWDMSTNPPTWIFAKSLTGYAGTHSGENHQEARNEAVITFRDSAGKFCKLIQLGGIDGRPSKATTIASSGYSDLINELLDDASDKAGAYFVSRGARKMASFVSCCYSSNNAIERKIVFG